MKRGKKPPIDVKRTLTRSERMGKAVFRVKFSPHLSSQAESWMKINCFQCRHQNVERLVESKLLGEEMYWQHICCHPGAVKLVAITSRGQGIHNCSGFENSPETSLEKP